MEPNDATYGNPDLRQNTIQNKEVDNLQSEMDGWAFDPQESQNSIRSDVRMSGTLLSIISFTAWYDLTGCPVLYVKLDGRIFLE